MLLKSTLALGAALFALSACGYKDAYEEAVYNEDPRYCYQQLGGISCYSTPSHQDAARLINYFGPHPDRYDPPAPLPRRESVAPAPVAYYSLDEETIPTDAPRHRAGDQ